MATHNIFDLQAEEAEMPFSILDTDYYKMTMQNAVLHHFPNANGELGGFVASF